MPNDLISLAVSHYPQLDKDALATQLQVFYRRDDMRDFSGLLGLLNFFFENNLDEVFSEIVKLLNILLCIPKTTAEAERKFSTLDRIKSLLRTTMCEERLNALTVLSSEKKIVQKDAFREAVINKFINMKDRRMEFRFK